MASILLQGLGAITATTLIYRFYNFINLYFVHKTTITRFRGEKHDAYALITGGSDGIGLATAKVLLRYKFNVILHGRNAEKLQKISKQLKKEFPNQDIAIVAAEATDIIPSIQTIKSAVQAIEKSGGKLTVLVNNIGGNNLYGLSPYSALEELPLETVSKGLDINAKFPTMLTNALLPNLISNTPSLIINVGSYAGAYPMPFLSTYAPSKAFNTHFSAGLSSEFKLLGHDIEVLGIVTGTVVTPGNPDATPGPIALTAEDFAESMIDRVGCGKRVVAGNWRHCLVGQLMSWFPEFMVESIFNKEMSGRRESDMKNR